MPRVIPKSEMAQLFVDGVIEDIKELRREYRVRKSSLEKKIIPLEEVDRFCTSGWELVKTSKRTATIQRKKRHQDQLEDDVWSLLFRMGYPGINRHLFKLPFCLEDGTVDKKQIDVFAKDGETVLVIECKSTKTRARRSLQKDLAETISFKKQMANAIRDAYGAEFKPKIIWIYVTRNIIWSEPDLERAKSAKINVLTENELSYYDAYVGHMGPAGKYQVLAEFLEGAKIPELSDVRVPAVKGRLGKYVYYSFVTTPRHLLKIAFVNHLALNHPDGRPAYQRMVNKNRLKKSLLLSTTVAIFPRIF